MNKTYKKRDGGPWRTVKSTRMIKDLSLKSFVVNTLECGHELQFSGSMMSNARIAKRRRCRECEEV